MPDNTKEVRVIRTETGEVEHTMHLSPKALDGFYQRVDWDRFHVNVEGEDF